MSQDREEVLRRLREDYAFYPSRCLKIVNKDAEVVPFRLKRPQLRLNLGLMEQRDAGRPQRAVLLKARQVGMSTDAQGLAIQRATQHPNHKAMTVAHRNKTASELFSIGQFMWANLPAEIKPQAAYQRNSRGGQKFLMFGEPSRNLRMLGVMGLNSQLEIESAEEVDAGRGLTLHTLHLSEYAFWANAAKGTALIEAVAERPFTLVLIESTAKGHNHFKTAWDLAESGASGYIAHFTPWFEDDEYREPFANDDDRADFEAIVGTGPLGEDEDELLELIPARVREWEAEAREWAKCYPADVLEAVPGFDGSGRPLLRLTDAQLRTRVLEHLYWRRNKIATPAINGDLTKFHAEYPATPDEAFIATGRKVFNPEQVRRVLKRCMESDPVLPSPACPGPRIGGFMPVKEVEQRTRHGLTIGTPQAVRFAERARMPVEERRRAHWRLWEMPCAGGTNCQCKACRSRESLLDKVPAGQYIVFADPATGEEDEEGTLAEHGLVVLNHRTLEQVGEFSLQRMDPDEIARELLMAALFFNRAWIGVENSGGYGLPILHRLARDYRYARVFKMQDEGRQFEHERDNLGWVTSAKTKPEMIARGQELLRTQADGIRSRKLAGQLLTYVADERGRTKPEKGKLADLLTSWLGGQMVAQRRPIRSDRDKRSSSTGAGGRMAVR